MLHLRPHDRFKKVRTCFETMKMSKKNCCHYFEKCRQDFKFES